MISGHQANGQIRTTEMAISPLAGHPAPPEMLVDVARLEREYFERRPDPDNPDERVSFGTSGHRGSPFRGSFTEAHILAITQAICDYRQDRGIDGPLYLGKDTHALSGPAQSTALEVLAANDSMPSSRKKTGSRRHRSFRTRSWFTIAGARLISPTGSSSLRHIIRPRMAVSSTTRQMAGPPIPTSRSGSNGAQTTYCAIAIVT